ncbi:MAG: polysaccharide biosynthesis tyrosine autokinase [Calditrichia bacterium]
MQQSEKAIKQKAEVETNHHRVSIDLDDLEKLNRSTFLQPVYFPKYWQSLKKNRWRVLITGISLTILWLIGIGLFYNPMYETTATLELYRSNDPESLPDQVKAFNTDFFLNALADSLAAFKQNLGISPESTISGLKANLQLDLRPSRTLLYIHYQDQYPQVAAKTANIVANAFLDYLSETDLKSASSKLEPLAKQLEQAQQDYVTAQAAFDEFADRYGIISQIPTAQNANNNLPELQQKIAKYNRDITTLNTILEKKKDYTKPEDVYDIYRQLAGFLTNNNVPGAAALSQQHTNKFNQRKVLLNQVYAKQTLQYQQLTKEISDLQNDIDRRVNSFLQESRNLLQEAESQLNRQQRSLDKSQTTRQQYTERQKRVESAKVKVDNLKEQYNRAKVVYALTYARGRILENAQPPVERPGIFRNPEFILGGLCFSFALSILVFIGLAHFDKKLIDAREIEFHMGLPVLAEIPSGDENWKPNHLNGKMQPENKPVANGKINYNVGDAFRNLRHILSPVEKNQQITILISSIKKDDGKTYIAANLASAFARAGQLTLLIDGNMRHGELSQLFGLTPTSGIAEFLQDNTPVNSNVIAKIINKTAIPNLFLIAAGKPIQHPADLLSAPRLDTLFDILKKNFAAIILDTPVCNNSPDAFALKRLVNETILVIGNSNKSLPELQNGLNQFLLNRMKIRGIVLNNVPSETEVRHSNPKTL